jgi:hypothetical protein
MLLGIVAAAATAVPIAAHVYLGTFARYIADDFCTASTLHRLGFAGSQAYWYQSWSGRYSYTFLVSLTQAIGPGLTPWLPLLALLIWVAVVVVAARALLGSGWGWFVLLAVAFVHVFGTLEGTPSVYQSLYWQTGMITYTLPLILSVAFAAWLWSSSAGEAGPRNRIAACAISLGAAFLLGGFSETYVALQTTAFVLTLLSIPWAVPRPKRSRTALLLSAGLAGSILSALTIALAPGTQLRRGLMPGPPALAPWIEATLKDGYLFVARTAKGSPEILALAILLPALLVLLRAGRAPNGTRTETGSSRNHWIVLVLLPAVTVILMLSTIAPYEFAVSSYPDARVLVSAMFVLVTGLVIWGATLGGQVAQISGLDVSAASRLGVLVLTTVVVGGLVLTAARSTSSILAGAADGRAYAQSWETRDVKLRQAAAAQTDQVTAASLRHMGGLAEIGRDPEEWINRCVAGTYGVGSVVAK